MRAAGAQFGLRVAEITMASLQADRVDGDLSKQTRHTICNEIEDRAAQWADSLRHTGLNPRDAEKLVTVWATAAHAAGMLAQAAGLQTIDGQRPPVTSRSAPVV